MKKGKIKIILKSLKSLYNTVKTSLQVSNKVLFSYYIKSFIYLSGSISFILMFVWLRKYGLGFDGDPKVASFSFFPKEFYYQMIPDSITETHHKNSIAAASVLETINTKTHLTTMFIELPHENPAVEYLFTLGSDPTLYESKIKGSTNGITYVIMDTDVKDFFITKIKKTPDEVLSILDQTKDAFNSLDKTKYPNFKILDSEAQYQRLRQDFRRNLRLSMNLYNNRVYEREMYNTFMSGAEMNAIAVLAAGAVVGTVALGIHIYKNS